MRYRIASRTGLILAATAALGMAGSVEAQNTHHSGGHNGAAMTGAAAGPPPSPPPPPPPPPAPPPVMPAAPPPPPNEGIGSTEWPVCSATVMDRCREGTAPAHHHRKHHRRRR